MIWQNLSALSPILVFGFFFWLFISGRSFLRDLNGSGMSTGLAKAFSFSMATSLFSLPVDLFRELLSNYILNIDSHALNLDQDQYSITFIVLQLVNKRFRAAVLNSNSRTSKIISNWKSMNFAHRHSLFPSLVAASFDNASASLASWMESLGYPINEECFQIATRGGNIAALDWLISRSYRPSEWMIRSTASQTLPQPIELEIAVLPSLSEYSWAFGNKTAFHGFDFDILAPFYAVKKLAPPVEFVCEVATWSSYRTVEALQVLFEEFHAPVPTAVEDFEKKILPKMQQEKWKVSCARDLMRSDVIAFLCDRGMEIWSKEKRKAFCKSK